MPTSALSHGKHAMYLFHCDESNLQEISGDFLLYGGIAIDGSNAAALSADIERIRTDAKLARTFELNSILAPRN